MVNVECLNSGLKLFIISDNGHGINKDTPEKNVHIFIENIRKEFS